MRLRVCSMLVGVVCTFAAGSRVGAAEPDSYSWVQFGADGLEARAVTPSGTCPAAAIDGQMAPMRSRAAVDAKFPNAVCALSIPRGAKQVTVAGAALPLPAAAPRLIAVIGDTGCRLKGGYLQACNDPALWPFRHIAEMVAAKHPDLIIHVGDYHYRETPCPGGDKGCAGSPFGDTWDVWREDFFAPAASLLAVAPWVFVRGNHEECARGGHGWSRMLEAAVFDAGAGCNGASAPFVVKLGGLSLAVIDTATAPEPFVDNAQVANFRAQYSTLTALGGPVWVLQHRPIWSTGGSVAGLSFGENRTLALAARGVLPANVQLIVSGHHHIFQVLGYAEDLPSQIVVGHGGDYLNRGRSANPAGWTINGVTVKSGLHQTGKFGFAMLEPEGEGWVITNYDAQGSALQRCGLKGREVGCIAE